ncbi:MAG: PilZ domain-containing protein [Acidiferrobacterales bacterium]|nr:PilZ domain-containing protein [Acidiferrobacterales bacterium]
MDADGRKHYRVTPDQQQSLDVTVQTADGQIFSAELLDITVEGAGTRFRRDAGPTLALGQAATLTFTSARLRQPIHVHAKVRSRAELGAFRSYRYGFEFDERDELQRQLSGEIFRLFNQRLFYRVEPDPAEPIEMLIRLPELDSATPRSTTDTMARGRVKDICGVGAALLLDRAVETTFAATDLVEVSFTLPSSGARVHLAAWIRHRELQDEYVCYGLEFDSVRSQQFTQQQNEILRYAKRRQLAEPPKRLP